MIIVVVFCGYGYFYRYRYCYCYFTRGKKEVAVMLLQNGANPSLKNNNGVYMYIN